MTDMTEADRMALKEAVSNVALEDMTDNEIASTFWQAALTHARGKQDPLGYIVPASIETLTFYPSTKLFADGSDGRLLPVYLAPPAESEELARLRADNARLTEALLFYADEDTYNVKYETEPCGCCGSSRIDIDDDQGETARAALAASPAPETDINAVCASPVASKPKVGDDDAT